MNGWLEQLHRFALSKTGVPFLIILLIGGAFSTGYNYYWVQDVFGQVQNNEKRIRHLAEVVGDNSEEIRRQKDRDKMIRRDLRIIGCSMELTETARQFLQCSKLEFDNHVKGP